MEKELRNCPECGYGFPFMRNKNNKDLYICIKCSLLFEIKVLPMNKENCKKLKVEAKDFKQ